MMSASRVRTGNMHAAQSAFVQDGEALRPRRPYPEGWFAALFSDELGCGDIRTCRVAGRELIVYRTEGGRIRAVDPYCPHLGAHIGAGGFVRGEQLVCPFHHFKFDVDGRCTETGYGTPAPSNANLTPAYVAERNGVAWVWSDSRGGAPQWDLPDRSDCAYSSPMRRSYVIVDHPQEIVENAVDIGHIGPVHGYAEARFQTAMRTQGPVLTVGSIVERVVPFIGRVEVSFVAKAYGLGCIYVDAEVPRVGIDAQFAMMATPISPIHVCVRFVVSLRVSGGPFARSPLASRIASEVLTRSVAPVFWRDIQRDFPIWENKRYVERPRLARGDGPIMQFRRWAEQFYDEAEGGVPVMVGDVAGKTV
jgi:nitrite reductase/ring-hydroxylating ferredoxin subunit